MPKILLNRTIQYKRKTYRLGETVEIPVEEVDNLLKFGKLIEGEKQPTVEVEQPKKSMKRSAKKVDK